MNKCDLYNESINEIVTTMHSVFDEYLCMPWLIFTHYSINYATECSVSFNFYSRDFTADNGYAVTASIIVTYFGNDNFNIKVDNHVMCSLFTTDTHIHGSLYRVLYAVLVVLNDDIISTQ